MSQHEIKSPPRPPLKDPLFNVIGSSEALFECPNSEAKKHQLIIDNNIQDGLSSRQCLRVSPQEERRPFLSKRFSNGSCIDLFADFPSRYSIAAVAVVGGALFGFDISSMSAIISTKAYLCYFNQGPYYWNTDGVCSGPTASVQGNLTHNVPLFRNHTDDLRTGGITASMPGGSWLGALISGYVSDILGRRRAIQVGSVIWVIGSIIVCASQNIGMLIVGRLINGLSVGICSAQVPVYITEIAPPSKRGRLVGCQQCEIAIFRLSKQFLTVT